MNGQEFARYMPPAALVATIAHVWDHFGHHDDELYVLRMCFDALVAAVGAEDAVEMMEPEIGESMIDFLAEVS